MKTRTHGLMGRMVSYTVCVTTSVGGEDTKSYEYHTGVAVSGAYGRGLWGKQYVNVLADDGRILELPLRTIIVQKEPRKTKEGWGKL